MKPRIVTNRGWKVQGLFAVCVLAGALVAASCTSYAAEEGAKAAEPPKPTTISTGSGQQYTTTVHRKTEGKLSQEDFRQVSLLSSRIVGHLNKAAQHLLDERNEDARKEIAKGLDLVQVVRDLLPTTVVTTVVKDAEGKEVYRYTDHVQDDRIPLFEGMVALDVLEPITDAKQEAAEVRGLRLADADVLHTSVLVELDYVERKLNRAAKLLKEEPEKALDQLVLAQTQGVTFEVNKEDNPLVAAQRALQLAERMVEQERPEAAKENLQLAKNHLVIYRGLIPKSEEKKVRTLEKDITKLQGQIGEEGAAEKIREFWDRVTGWFTRQPGKAEKTTEETEQKKEKEEK